MKHSLSYMAVIWIAVGFAAAMPGCADADNGDDDGGPLGDSANECCPGERDTSGGEAGRGGGPAGTDVVDGTTSRDDASSDAPGAEVDGARPPADRSVDISTDLDGSHAEPDSSLDVVIDAEDAAGHRDDAAPHDASIDSLDVSIDARSDVSVIMDASDPEAGACALQAVPAWPFTNLSGTAHVTGTKAMVPRDEGCSELPRIATSGTITFGIYTTGCRYSFIADGAEREEYPYLFRELYSRDTIFDGDWYTCEASAEDELNPYYAEPWIWQQCMSLAAPHTKASFVLRVRRSTGEVIVTDGCYSSTNSCTAPLYGAGSAQLDVRGKIATCDNGPPPDDAWGDGPYVGACGLPRLRPPPFPPMAGTATVSGMGGTMTDCQPLSSSPTSGTVTFDLSPLRCFFTYEPNERDAGTAGSASGDLQSFGTVPEVNYADDVYTCSRTEGSGTQSRSFCTQLLGLGKGSGVVTLTANRRTGEVTLLYDCNNTALGPCPPPSLNPGTQHIDVKGPLACGDGG